LSLAKRVAAPHLRAWEFSMSERQNKRSSTLFDLALTAAAAAFIFFTSSGLLHAYAP
jgi:hypothetical protein